MNNSFDVIIIGVGSMGSSTCYYLSRRGYKVLGLEQFDIVHEFGSHAGQSRIIRKAYFENPGYVPLLVRAYENWKYIQEESKTRLYFPAGLAYFGPAGHPLIKGVKESASLYNIQVKKIDKTEMAEQFSQFKIPGNFSALFEPDAGFVRPEKAIRVFADQAMKRGAVIKTREKVLDWKKEGRGIKVITDKNSYHSGKLVITAGAWAGKVIPWLSDKIRITRQFVAWINPGNWDHFTLNNFPCWLLADDETQGCYYGFPILPETEFGSPMGLKLAHHWPASQTEPGTVNRLITAEDENDLKYLLNTYFSIKSASIVTYKICLYANSPDEHFVIDKLPGHEDHVIIASGFSGHGFKFVPVVGEILADLATNGETDLPIEFLSAKRFFK